MWAPGGQRHKVECVGQAFQPDGRIVRLESLTYEGEVSLMPAPDPAAAQGAGQAETFILIPGRTARQGTTLNEGKFSTGYVEETSTLIMCPDDMARLGLKNGERVRVRSPQGQIELPCQGAK